MGWSGAPPQVTGDMTCAVGSDRKQENLQQDVEDPPLSLEQLHFPQFLHLVAKLRYRWFSPPVCMWEASPWEASPWEASPWDASPWEASPWEASPCLAQKLLPMLMAYLC